MEKRKASFLQPCPEHEPYADLIKHLTTHQHAILIDLGMYLKTYLSSTLLKSKIICVHVFEPANHNYLRDTKTWGDFYNLCACDSFDEAKSETNLNLLINA